METVGRNYNPLASERFIATANAMSRLNENLEQVVFRPAAKTFESGRRLSRDQFTEAAKYTRDLLKSAKLPAYDEQVQPGADGQPSAIEFRTITQRYTTGPQGNRIYMVANTIYMDDQRFYIDSEDLPASSTTHAIDRFEERIVDRDPAQFATELIWATGLAVVWNHAVVAEGMKNNHIVIPIDGGIAMGKIWPVDRSGIGQRRSISALGDRSDMVRNRSIISPDNPMMMVNELQSHINTIVDDQRLYPEQRHMKQMLKAFQEEHRGTLNKMLGIAVWPTARLRPRPSRAAVAEFIQPASKQLRGILRQPEIKAQLELVETRQSSRVEQAAHHRPARRPQSHQQNHPRF